MFSFPARSDGDSLPDLGEIPQNGGIFSNNEFAESVEEPLFGVTPLELPLAVHCGRCGRLARITASPREVLSLALGLLPKGWSVAWSPACHPDGIQCANCLNKLRADFTPRAARLRVAEFVESSFLSIQQFRNDWVKAHTPDLVGAARQTFWGYVLRIRRKANGIDESGDFQ